MSLLFTFVALACAPTATVRGPAVQTACPPDDPYIRNGIKDLLANERARTSLALHDVRAWAVRFLADPADSAVCEAIMSKVQGTPIDPNHVLRYGLYEADGYYFAGIMIYTTTGTFAYEPGELIVLDSALSLVSSSIF